MKKLKLQELTEAHSQQELEKQELLHILGGQILPDDYEEPLPECGKGQCTLCMKSCAMCKTKV